ncbi:MAG: hypothetical protein GY697_00470 [Desulfobacterales bacterium]|nr:hypothetical protein [Desulfobacterales bacterium]
MSADFVNLSRFRLRFASCAGQVSGVNQGQELISRGVAKAQRKPLFPRLIAWMGKQIKQPEETIGLQWIPPAETI